MLRGSTVPQGTQHVQYALGGTNVQTVHLQWCVHRDNMHPFDPQPVRHVPQVIDALCKECPLRRAVLMDNTQTKHCRQDVILVKLVGSVQMATDLCRVQLAILVNMDSPTARHVSQGITALLGHPIVFHVRQESSVLVLLLSLSIVRLALILLREKVSVSHVHKVSILVQ